MNYQNEHLGTFLTEKRPQMLIPCYSNNQLNPKAANVAGPTIPSTVSPFAAWKDLTAVMGKLPGQYHNGASFVMPPALFFGEVLGMTDSTGNRVVVADPQEPRKYNVLGFPCIVDGNAATDEVYFGDLKAYKFNFAKDPEVKCSEDAEFRKGSNVWRAMALADGKLADQNAIIRAIRST